MIYDTIAIASLVLLALTGYTLYRIDMTPITQKGVHQKLASYVDHVIKAILTGMSVEFGRRVIMYILELLASTSTW